MNSPGVYLARDILGAGRVLARKATSPSGVVARGNRLVIRLTRPAPDFPHRMASTFFCAVKPSLPIDPEGVGAFPAAGPYYVAEYRRGERVVLRQNRFYGGAAPSRRRLRRRPPRSVAPGSAAACGARRSGLGPYAFGDLLRPALGLVDKYGVNRSQLHVRPGLTLRMLGFNSSRPLFRSNPDLRRAVNFALNRQALVNLGGSLVSRPSDQYLPAILPGFRDADVYPLERPDLQRARALANGNLRGGKAILYVNSSPLPTAIGQQVKQQLAEIGLDVEVRGIPIHSASAAYFNKLATPGEPWDIAFGLWSPSYIDPFAYINLLFDGRFVGGTNFTRFASGPLDRQMRQAARMPQGSSRDSAYAAVDVRLAREAAPIAAVDFLNEPTLVSKRVGCMVLRPVIDLTAVCLTR